MNKVVNLRGLDAKIEAMQSEILSQHLDPEGMNTRDLAHLVAKKMSSEDIKSLTKIISKTINKMAIGVKVTYILEDQLFTLDFRTEDIDDKVHGKVVHIGLQEILFYKCTYQQPIEASLIAVLLYSFVQKEVA